MDLSDRNQLQQHVNILGWLFIAEHVILLLVAAFVFVLLVGIGAVSRDPDAFTVLGIVGTLVGLFLAALSLPGILAGVGLLRRRAWGRYLALVVGILGLINFPIGTLVGAYAAWVLLQSSATEYFTPSQMV
jgi:hypothetical protein